MANILDRAEESSTRCRLSLLTTVYPRVVGPF